MKSQPRRRWKLIVRIYHKLLFLFPEGREDWFISGRIFRVYDGLVVPSPSRSTIKIHGYKAWTNGNRGLTRSKHHWIRVHPNRGVPPGTVNNRPSF
jgi:hypothetical protein